MEYALWMLWYLAAVVASVVLIKGGAVICGTVLLGSCAWIAGYHQGWNARREIASSADSLIQHVLAEIEDSK